MEGRYKDMKGNVIVGQSGGPTAVINSSLAGVFKTAMERGYNKVYGMRYGIQGFMDEQYVDLSDYIKNELDLSLLKRTPSAFLGTCRYKLPEIHENKESSSFWTSWRSRSSSISAEMTPWILSASFPTMHC